MKVAIVVPLDFTAFLCCKVMIEDLNTRRDIDDLFVVCDETLNSEYIGKLESWGARCIKIQTPRHISIISDLKYLKILYRIFKLESPDTIIAACTKPNIYAPLAGRLAGIKNIFTSVWGRGTAFTDDNRFDRKIIRIILVMLYKISFYMTKNVWFTNPNDYTYFLDHKIVNEDKCLLTKNYIDIDVFNKKNLDQDKIEKYKSEFNISENDIVVVLVGRMIWPKGIREFVEASKIVAKQNHHVKFWLLGAEEITSPDSVPVEYLLEASKEDNFQWLGYQEDIINIYGASDIAVLPSYYREGGYPRALTEPMALEMPVIAADSIDCRAPVDHGSNGYLVPIKDHQELAARILELASDHDKRVQFGIKSRLKAESEYDEKKIVKVVMDYFTKEQTQN